MTQKSRIFLPILVLLLGGFCAFLFVYFKRETKPQPIIEVPPLVRVITAASSNHQFTVRSQGTVTPQREIQLVTEVAGRVTKTSPSLAAGGFFEAGETLVIIDPRDYELARIRAAAQVRQAETRLTQEKAEAQLALKEWEEMAQDKGQPSELLLRKPQLAEAQATLDAAQASLDQAHLNLERTRIKAPFRGRVWEKRVDIGQYVTPGISLGRLYSVDFAEVRLPVSLPDIAYLDLPTNQQLNPDHPRPQVRLHASVAQRPHTWTGQIVRLEGEINPANRMVTLVAQVADPYDQTRQHPDTAPLAVGLFVEAEIMGRSVKNVFSLPRTALRGNSQVLIVDDQDKLRFRDVNILRSDRNQVLVDRGLNDGDKISVSLLESPLEGMDVKTKTSTGTTPAPQPPSELSTDRLNPASTPGEQ